jgi:dienelactone hydrolase
MRLVVPIAIASCAAPFAESDPAPDRDAAAGGDAATPPPDADPGPAPDPAGPGPHAVTTTTAAVRTSLGTAAVVIFTPAGPGPFPVVIVSPGFQIDQDRYAGTCAHVASWGYLVISHDYTGGNHDQKAAEVAELIDWAVDADLPADATRIGVAGHSLGGKVSIRAAIEDPRIGAVIGWDPVDALPPIGNDGSTSVTPERMGQLTAPMVVLGQTGDTGCAPAADNFQQYFAHACAAAAVLEVTIAAADHTDWVDDRAQCGIACLLCGQGATADATVRTITRRVTVAWLETHLRGRAGLGEYLSAPGVGSPASVRSVVPGC